MICSGWGRFPVINSSVYEPTDIRSLGDLVNEKLSYSCQGNARSYGDSSLNSNSILKSNNFNLFESFDSSSGLLVAGSGVILKDIIDVFLPKGYFLLVSPGTKYVSLGGAVAFDVHGKDHHISGSFSNSVEFIDVLTADHGVLRASRSENSDLFYATVGGLGLTGFILKVGLKLKKVPSGLIKQRTIKCDSIDECISCFNENMATTYSVAWIDCLQKNKNKVGRSLYIEGEFVESDYDELKKNYDQNTGVFCEQKINYQEPKNLNVPFDFPSWFLNKFTVKSFNSLYFNRVLKKDSTSDVNFDKFFYPLDAILQWNRIYGKAGFTQYQFVIPKDDASYRLRSILGEIAKVSAGSFLTVLKMFGEHNNPDFITHKDNVSLIEQKNTSNGSYQSKDNINEVAYDGGILSFPMSGYTLALDFPIDRKILELFKKLNTMICDYGGRLYLAKDCQLNQQCFEIMYGSRVNAFLKVKAKYDSKNKFSSLQSQRLGLFN